MRCESFKEEMVAPCFPRLCISRVTDSDWAEVPHLICNQALLGQLVGVANSFRQQLSETQIGVCGCKSKRAEHS